MINAFIRHNHEVSWHKLAVTEEFRYLTKYCISYDFKILSRKINSILPVFRCYNQALITIQSRVFETSMKFFIYSQKYDQKLRFLILVIGRNIFKAALGNKLAQLVHIRLLVRFS